MMSTFSVAVMEDNKLLIDDEVLYFRSVSISVAFHYCHGNIFFVKSQRRHEKDDI